MKIAIIGRTKILRDTALKLLEANHEIPVIWTCKDEDFYKFSIDDWQKFSDEIGAEFINDVNINSDKNQSKLKNFFCDIAVSYNWLTLVKKTTFDIFKYGVLNAHMGDLPKYRGNACPNWAILNSEKEVCVSIHEMAEELDAGDILLKKRMALTDETYIQEIYDWMDHQIPGLFCEAVNGIAEGNLMGQAQSKNPDDILRVYPRRPEDSLINWDTDVKDVLRLIRASSHPFGGAFSYLEGQEKVIIWKAEQYHPPFNFCAVPGQVCTSLQGDPIIACQNGLLRLTNLDVVGCESEEEAKKKIYSSLRNRLKNRNN